MLSKYAFAVITAFAVALAACGAKKEPQPIAQDGMIIHKQNTDAAHVSPPCASQGT